MKHKKILLIFALALAAVLIVGSASAARPAISQDQAIWELSKAQIVDPGQTGTTDEGLLTVGYTIEAQAKARHGGLLPVGTFQLTLSAFSPAKDLPGQEAGKWYVQGKWTITQMGADPQGAKARHSPYVAQGTLTGVLSFNPAAAPGDWTARAILPMSLAAGQWARGNGNLTLDAQNNGTLYLDLKLWPKSQGGSS